MNDCEVTVLMPVYNAERFLREAIDSILAQTFQRFEFLIINDGSTDGSLAIIKSYQDPRIRLLENPVQIGVTRSLNLGVAEARGKFIARMDADDISLPERLEKQVAHMTAHPDCGVVGCAFELIDINGEPIHGIEFFGEHDFLRWYLFFQNPFSHPATMLRKEALAALHGYDTQYVFAQDYDLWWRASWTTRFSALPDQLFRLRRHPTNITSGHMREQMELNVKVRQLMVPRMLGRPAAAFGDTLETSAWNTPAVIGLIIEVYQHMTAKVASAVALQMIQRDAAARLAILFLRHPLDSRAWRGLAFALKLDALVFFRMLGWPVSRFFFKKAYNPIVYCA